MVSVAKVIILPIQCNTDASFSVFYLFHCLTNTPTISDYLNQECPIKAKGANHSLIEAVVCAIRIISQLLSMYLLYLETVSFGKAEASQEVIYAHAFLSSQLQGAYAKRTIRSINMYIRLAIGRYCTDRAQR